MSITEAEVTVVHPPGTQLAAYTGQVEEYRPRIVMAAEDAKALDDQLRAMQLAVLRKGTDYDTIPGMGDRPTLLKPGAEKLIQWFGFGFTMNCAGVERDDENRKFGVTYRCTITKRIGDPDRGLLIEVATCEGYAGYDEDRFYQTDEQAKARAERNERKWAAQYNRAPKPAKWEYATGYRASWNTVIKMAQKRALVGAAIDATAAAGLFTQDLEDMPQAAAAGSNDDAPADGTWESAIPAPPRQDPQDDSPPWTVDRALEEAASFKSETAGQQLWREAAKAHREGRCTRDEQDHIQNIITARIRDRRKEAATRILASLPEDDPWRDKILDLGSDFEARSALEEVRLLLGGGQIDDERAQLLSRGIIARCPKAAVQDLQATA